ncbi:MAG TPA: APC family permease [Ktedonobacteraceae bacterium]
MMHQTSPEQPKANQGGKSEEKEKASLGPFLCWAVVFADIGTSIYYVPGILYGTVGPLTGFFVFLTMIVFILLTLKYAEVTYRFPQGGGVVTVAARALNHWFGALGGMFILVDYFLTAAISCLSGMLYLSVIVKAIGPQSLFLGFPIPMWITLGMLLLLGLLNWVGVSASAKVSLVGAAIAFFSDLAILVTVFTHISFAQFLALFPQMFQGHALTLVTAFTGFAGSFLAFSGLESISQLSPVMKLPRRKVGKSALFLVVLTVGLTSPFLALFSTLLLPNAAAHPVLSAQIISLLAGKWGGPILQTEVAISASALLVFASNTAIIGSYHVFLALSRMEFFPQFMLRRNKLRDTPHYSIMLASGIPILVLLLVHGNITLLGDMYAFGLLGAFALTCLGMDVVRYRQRHIRHKQARGEMLTGKEKREKAEASSSGPYNSVDAPEAEGRWTRSTCNFVLGILTTVLVIVAWSTNLVAKPLATAFGGSVALIGMAIAVTNYALHRRKGRVPVIITGVEKAFRGEVLAVLSAHNPSNEAIIREAITQTGKKPVVFLFLGEDSSAQKPELFRLVEPHLNDSQAREYLGRANHQAREAGIATRFLYRHQSPDAALQVWEALHPRETIVTEEQAETLQGIHPTQTQADPASRGKVVHLMKE